MKKLLMTCTLLAISMSCNAGLFTSTVVSIENTSSDNAYVKLLDPNSRTECSTEISVKNHSTVNISSSQATCDSKHYRIKAYGQIEANAKASSVFKKGGHCVIRVDKPLDDRFHVDCNN